MSKGRDYKEQGILKMSNGLSTVSRNVTLSTKTALPDDPCRAVELFCDDSNALIFSSNGGEDFTALANGSVLVYCNNAKKISVAGTGTLSYLVHR